jgi:myo-inositol 2-dehydrogenase / D-chiro-inositol 1-dehydrogenase
MQRSAENMRQLDLPLRTVIAGCGAVTRLYYAPSLQRLTACGTVQVVGVFDPDEAALRTISSALPDAVPTATADELFKLGAELAIVASPPRYHAQQAICAFRKGLHVFCEKPIATSVEDANHMIAAADSAGRNLMVNLVRRQMPAVKAIGELLGKGTIGRLRSIDCFEGGPFAWPISAARYFEMTESGGGVLQDIGTHCLDLLTWWLGPPISLTYEDDRMGGVEANCRAELQFPTCTARVQLSRDWARPNIYQFEGDAGRLTWSVNDTDCLELSLRTGLYATLKLRTLDQEIARQLELTFEDCFTLQLAAMAGAIRGGDPPPVPARAGRDVLALINRCYHERQQIVLPWLNPAEQDKAARLAGVTP